MDLNAAIFSVCTRCPRWTWKWLFDFLVQLKYRKCMDEILNEQSDRAQEDPDLAKALSYLQKTRKLTYLPGEYEKKYKKIKIEVYRDKDGFPFVQFEGKRLYFPKHFSKSWVAYAYRTLMCEQDSESPHCYFSNAFGAPAGGEILLDVGAAEGIISLKYVEQVKRIIIFECSKDWIPALKKTFYPYREKVSIVSKYVSDNSGNDCVRLDDYIVNDTDLDGFNDTYIVKMDIEDAESVALDGSMKLLESRKSKFLVCTYHRPEDAKKFKKLFQSMGYRTQFSMNYMLLGWSVLPNVFGKPSFRKGVIQACPLKEDCNCD